MTSGLKQDTAGTAVTIAVDNQSCIALSRNPEYRARTKHIDIQHHFVREAVENEEIVTEFCPTGEMVADALTKPLPTIKHQFLWKKGIVGELKAPACLRGACDSLASQFRPDFSPRGFHLWLTLAACHWHVFAMLLFAELSLSFFPHAFFLRSTFALACVLSTVLSFMFSSLQWFSTGRFV
jgi:hypothetical protein